VALQLAYHGGERRERGQLFDLPSELVAALQLVQQERVVLAVESVDRFEQQRAIGGQILQPPEVRSAPSGSLTEHEAAAGDEPQEIVPRLTSDPGIARFARTV
jgi:hypothetical protein